MAQPKRKTKQIPKILYHSENQPPNFFYQFRRLFYWGYFSKLSTLTPTSDLYCIAIMF